MSCRWFTGPTALAIVVTLANAAKPVVVDDTAYLLFARQISQHPLDPYGFELFWYTKPEPAMGILAPPVLPYWLAVGIRLFGEHVTLLKLWMFPFAWLLSKSLDVLLRRFARGVEQPALVLLMFSPAVLVTINVMLDIPAMAFGLASIAIFLHACDDGRKLRAILSGVLLALALQTKYTMLVAPAVIVWAGLLRHRLGLAAIVLGTAAILFTAWECWLHAKYGESHFLFHLHDQQATGTWQERLDEKWALVPPFFAFLGGFATLLAFWAARPIGWPRWVIGLTGLLALVGIVGIVFFPFPETVLIAGSRPGREKLTLAALVWRALGAGVVFVLLTAIAVLLVKGRPLRHSKASLFVVGWLLLEIAAYFALTPFPASRRLIGVTLVSGILLARAVSRMKRLRPERTSPRWVIPAAVIAGALFALLDGYDASIEKTAVERAVAVAKDRGYAGRIWFVGHWGFQYYADRAGFTHFEPSGRSRALPGDWVVLPEYPLEEGFWRPWPGGGYSWYRLKLPEEAEVVERIVLDDGISGMTVPNFYGGVDPIASRSRPRLVVDVLRLKQPWGDSFIHPAPR